MSSQGVGTKVLDRDPLGDANEHSVLDVEELIKRYSVGGRRRARTSDRNAVDGVSFQVERGELFTLLGPSGCGKSTTLRCLAGLESPDGGAISVLGRPIFDAASRRNVPANRRGFGMVFQSYAVWPHMTVFENIEFPLDASKAKRSIPKAEKKRRVDRILEVTGLARYADRSAARLSGGQQQRLALARALVTEPEVLLLDEPLSNLDAKLREAMRFELKRMQRELNVTTIYVTHDQSEALALSSRIAVINDGRVAQIGSPDDIYFRPQNEFVAGFVGTANLLPGRVMSTDSDLVRVETVVGQIIVRSGDPYMAGDSVTLSIRPEFVKLGESDGDKVGDGVNVVEATLLEKAFLGESVDCLLRFRELEFHARIGLPEHYAAGESVTMRIDPDHIAMMRRSE